MKKVVITLFLSLNFLTTSFSQPYEYLVETTSIDSFVVIEMGRERIVRSSRVDNTEFAFECNDPSKTFIRLHCESCEVELTAKLYCTDEDGFTQWIKLGHKEKISIESCFSQYPEETGLSAFISDAMGKIQLFWSSFRSGRTARRRTPILKSADILEDDPKLEFLNTDYFYFLQKEDLLLQFRNIENYPIKSIYLISHDGELIFHAGSREILGNLFILEGKTSPKVSFFTKKIKTNKNENLFEIRWNSISGHLLSPLHPGKWYQIGVELEEDVSEHNPYLFNFQVYTAEQLKELKRFIDRA